MILIPICEVCKKRISLDEQKRCPYCGNTGITSTSKISSKIKKLRNELEKSDELVEKRDISRVIPPPVPPKIDPQTQNLPTNFQIAIQREKNTEQGIKMTYLFRRGIILVFEEIVFEMFLQQSWIRKVLNEIQISFERKFTNENDEEHVLVTILRLKIMYVNGSSTIKEFFSDKSIHDEMAFRLSNAFIIIKDSPLSDEWYNFLMRRNKNTSNSYIYYLTRVQMDKNHYNNYLLTESEQLFISLIKKLLIIQDQVELSIVNNKSTSRILDPVVKGLIDANSLYNNSKLSITGTNVNCMGHGGPIDQPVTCSICGGSLCDVCAESFLICPGSMATDLHKFLKK